MSLGKTLSDYNPSNLPTRELIDVGIFDNAPVSFGNPDNSSASYGDVRTTKSPDSGPSSGDRSYEYPPYFPFFTGSIDEPRLSMIQGYIYTYHGDSNDLDSMSELKVLGMPVGGDSIAADIGTKCWVVADEDAYGELSNVTFSSGNDWPVSIPAKLIGGEDDEGIPGFRIWRLCEISSANIGDEEDPIEVPILEIHRTGIIEHRTPRRLENTTNAVSMDEGRVYKEFDEESGEYKLRVAKGKRGVDIIEGTGEDEDFLKIMMPEGADGAILYFYGETENPEDGEWIQLNPPETSPGTGNIWVLSAPGGPLPPEWLEVSESGEKSHHPWKVIHAGGGDWDYVGGDVYFCGQGATINIPDGTVNGTAGFVLLHITRDSSTREGLTADVIWSATVPDSDYVDQYRVLAYVHPTGPHKVTQHQFEEIRLFEELVIINGAFALQTYEISHRNNYDPPP
jgi:hypothetical protein